MYLSPYFSQRLNLTQLWCNIKNRKLMLIQNVYLVPSFYHLCYANVVTTTIKIPQRSAWCYLFINTPILLHLQHPYPLDTKNVLFISMILSFQECGMNGIIQYVIFWDFFFFIQNTAFEVHLSTMDYNSNIPFEGDSNHNVDDG